MFSKGIEPRPSEIAKINKAVLARGLGLGAVFVHSLSHSDVLQNNLVIHIDYFVLFFTFFVLDIHEEQLQ